MSGEWQSRRLLKYLREEAGDHGWLPAERKGPPDRLAFKVQWVSQGGEIKREPLTALEEDIQRLQGLGYIEVEDLGQHSMRVRITPAGERALDENEI